MLVVYTGAHLAYCTVAWRVGMSVHSSVHLLVHSYICQYMHEYVCISVGMFIHPLVTICGSWLSLHLFLYLIESQLPTA